MPVTVTPWYRLTQTIKLTGWTVEEIDNTPAEVIDWLLAINRTEAEVEAERQRKANEAARNGR